MSKYTTELRFICEKLAGLEESEGYDSVKDIIANSRAKLFDFEYPIFDEAYRPVLETKIIKHYYTREICAETVGRWKLFLEERMNEIMPYYNDLYNSALITYDPLTDVNYTRQGEKSGQKITDGTDTMTGTVGDVGNTSNTRATTNETVSSKTAQGTENVAGEHTNTIVDDGVRTDNLTEQTNGTRTDNLTEDTVNTRTDNLKESSDSTRTDNLTESVESTRTDDLQETTNNTRTDHLTESVDGTRTDNLSEGTNSTRTDNLQRRTVDGGTETVSRTSANKNSRWDLYSDTPQGGIAGLEGTMDDSSLGENAYLTNARHITDDGTGSTSSDTTTFGKTVTTNDTGTQQNVGTKTNTGTQRNESEKTNTGTQENDGSKVNTGTQTNNSEKENTGTQRNVGEKENTGTQENVGSKVNTGTQETEGSRSNTGTQRNENTRSDTGENSETRNRNDTENSNVKSDGGVVDEGNSSNTRTYDTTNRRSDSAVDTGEYLEKVFGKMGSSSYPKMIMEYRETLMNVDMLIIHSLSDLFIRLW